MHTPGPWKAHERRDAPPFVTRADDNSGWICQTLTWCGSEEAIANARLVAAAPDLLWFVGQIFYALDSGKITIKTDYDEVIEAILSRGRSALSQAEAI